MGNTRWYQIRLSRPQQFGQVFDVFGTERSLMVSDIHRTTRKSATHSADSHALTSLTNRVHGLSYSHSKGLLLQLLVNRDQELRVHGSHQPVKHPVVLVQYNCGKKKSAIVFQDYYCETRKTYKILIQ
jgi:hypothetical protein